MQRFSYSVACVLGLAVLAQAALADTPTINDRKAGNANDVKMTVFGKGDTLPMDATIAQAGSNVVLTIVQGGGTTAKPVEIVDGTCAKPGTTQFRLPPLTGSQYVATAKNANAQQLQDDNHALVVWGSNGKQRTMFACGDLVKPNALRH